MKSLVVLMSLAACIKGERVIRSERARRMISGKLLQLGKLATEATSAA